jgi:UDP-N-acetylmuramate dehydrogenase
MLDPNLRQALHDLLGERVVFDEPLSRHTSFRIGGPADAWIEVDEPAQIGRVLELLRGIDVPRFVLGGGTNVLVSDRGVRGVVLHLSRAFAVAEWTEAVDHVAVRAGAAMPFKKLVTETIQRGLAGLEFAEGIPGSVGGGLLMNAGAFGGEISQVVDHVDGVDRDGCLQRLERSGMKFSYRHFDLPAGFVVTHVGFRLRPDDPAVVSGRREELRRRRQSRQPLGYPNAGSVFKNPPGNFAGRLIESVGLKGRRIGNAQISPEHANFIINLGGACATDVRALMDEAVRAVEAASGPRLEPEIKLIGDWS